MKTTGAFFAFLMLVMVASNSAQAQCSSSIDKICKAFNGMSSQVNRVTSLEDFDYLDFDSAINNSGVYSIPDSCVNYRLTANDKAKLKKSFDGFCDTMVNKLYSLAGGLLSRQDIAVQINPMKKAYTTVLNNSTTLGDFIDGLSYVFN